MQEGGARQLPALGGLHGNRLTTKAEKQWMDDITQLGCIVCILLGKGNTPAIVHHILKNGQRQSHLETIPLCDPGHHQGGDGWIKISRHPTKTRFEVAYGTEQYLLDATQKLVKKMKEVTC